MQDNTAVDVGTGHYTLEEAYLALRRTRVLVAEDDDEMRALLVTHLQRRGLEVVAVSSGSELMRKLRHAARDDDFNRPYDAIISDVRMPQRTGLDVLAEFRTQSWATPFFLITAFGEEWIHREADRLGARVFDKPFDLTRMADAVVASLDGGGGAG